MCLLLSVIVVIIYYCSTILGIKNFCNLFIQVPVELLEEAKAAAKAALEEMDAD